MKKYRNRMFKLTLLGSDWYIGFFPGAVFAKWIRIYN